MSKLIAIKSQHTSLSEKNGTWMLAWSAVAIQNCSAREINRYKIDKCVTAVATKLKCAGGVGEKTFCTLAIVVTMWLVFELWIESSGYLRKVLDSDNLYYKKDAAMK
ncbi:hypothetical protein J6590_106442, partial [Homalodisca vitripennis]